MPLGSKSRVRCAAAIVASGRLPSYRILAVVPAALLCMLAPLADARSRPAPGHTHSRRDNARKHHAVHVASANADRLADAAYVPAADQGSPHLVTVIPASNQPAFQLVSFRTSIAAESTHPSGGILQSGLASWYGHAWKGRRTASGARFDPEAMTAASHTLPLGTRVWVTLEGTARSVLVTITDYQGSARRVIDLSIAAARQIGIVGMGTAHVVLRRA